MTEGRPKVLICSVEFLSSRKVTKSYYILERLSNSTISQVKDVIYSCRLAPDGLRPLICIDEAQVEKKL